MTKYISILFISAIVLVASFTSCSDDETYRQGVVTLHKTGLFFDKDDITGEFTQSTRFVVDNVASLGIDEVPEGWSVELEFFKGIITVTRPANSLLDDDNTITEISFRGETPNGYSVTATLDVGVVEYNNIADEDVANSIIVTKPNVFYTFSPSFKGEQAQGVSLSGVEDCQLLWRSYPGSVRHVQMLNSGLCGFYISADEYDLDKDGDKEDFHAGNAVIAALNSSDEVVWSWHIWASEEEVKEITFNGQQFMDRNLGALSAKHADALSTYGMFYQWGRKDPFVGPYEYEATDGISALVMGSGDRPLKVKYSESTSTIGTADWTVRNPDTFILGKNSPNHNWSYSNDETLWSDSEKSIYDPSPKGWRVAKSTDFNGVTIVDYPDELEGYKHSYAANLKGTDGNIAMFPGLGRRNYITGRIINTNSSYNPWTGYYWTSGCTVDNNAKALLFSNQKLFYREECIDAQYPMQRANGFQIRCVKNL